MRLLTNLGRAPVAVAWLAACFLSLWLARLVGDVFIQATLRPLLGDAIATWHITPVAARFALRPGSGSDATRSALQLLPVLLQLLGLVMVAWRGARWTSGVRSIVLHGAGIWAMLFVMSHLASLALHPAAPLARLLGPAAGMRSLRIALALVLLVVIIAAAAICARRLLAMLRESEAAPAWRGGAWMMAAVIGLLACIAGERLGWLVRARSPWFFVPLLVVLVVVTLGLLRPRGRSPRPLEARGRGLLIASAALLCALLAGVPLIRGWAAARDLARVDGPRFEIAYSASQFDRAEVESLALQLEAALDSMQARAVIAAVPKLRLVLYPDFEAMRAATQQEERDFVTGTDIHTTCEGATPRLENPWLARAALAQSWGAPGGTIPAAWAASWLAQEWRRQPLASWVAQIQFEEGRFTLHELLAPESDRDLSPLVRTPLGAAWLASVAGSRDHTAVQRLYAGDGRGVDAAASILGTTAPALESDWRAWCDTIAAHTDVTELERWRPDASLFWRGMTLSHEGHHGGGGYDSHAARAALERLRDMGVNAIALVPYGFQRAMADSGISYLRSDESDAELSAGLRAAHALGMRVMLKPQLWVRHGQFTGEIAFENAAARARWMRSYRRFALHYARLAELEGFDLLCIGTELGGVTRHTSEWRALIRDVRRVYHGPITYAAHWDREIAGIAFWDAVDFIGINAYAPLSSPGQTDAESAAMRRRAVATGTQLESLARRWRRPVLFTEIGYASVPGCAVEPWSESGPVDVAAQAAAYGAALSAYARAPWLRGMFWWKWHSNGAGGGGLDPSFTPMGKPAADTLRTWFTRLAAQVAAHSAVALADTMPRLRPDTTTIAPRDTVPLYEPEEDTTSVPLRVDSTAAGAVAPPEP